MITTIDSEIFTYNEEIWSKEKQEEFFKKHGKNAIAEFVTKNGLFHVTYESFEGKVEPSDIRIPISGNLFKDAYDRMNDECAWIACDTNGNYQTVIKWVPSYYAHMYNYDGDIDVSLLNQYDSIVLYGMNEYAVELFKHALPLWTGKRIVLCGEWMVLGNYLSSIPGKEIMIQNDWNPYIPGILNGVGEHALHVKEGLPRNENYDRFDNESIILFEELMTYTFCFSNIHHLGEMFPNKKFFLLDGTFTIEGILGMVDKLLVMAKYAQSKGYEPVFAVFNSNDNIYSDYYGEDIWGKFFNQPCGVSLQELSQAKNIVYSPNANCLTIMRHIMDMNTIPPQKIQWKYGECNSNVEKYIAKRMKLLKDPKETLGVLIRGTDYQSTKLPGHSIHAKVPQIIDKITEIEKEHPYKYIYLSTEDETVLEDMKKTYKDRLIYTDQKRFSVAEGQLLVDMHRKRERTSDEGFRLGVEYLCTLRLLSKCESLLASGGCGGVSEAIRLNNGKYRFIDICDLGINSRI